MAEFQAVMRELNRLCKGRLCDDCPIWEKHDTTTDICLEWIKENSVEAERIIMKWASEHPKKTNRQKFVEVFGCEIVTHEIHDAIPGHVKILNASDEEFEEWLDSEYEGGQDEQ